MEYSRADRCSTVVGKDVEALSLHFDCFPCLNKGSNKWIRLAVDI